MPTYDYRCDNGHLQEEIHLMDDEPEITCKVCGKPMKKSFSSTKPNLCTFDHSDPEGTLWKNSKMKGKKGWSPYIP